MSHVTIRFKVLMQELCKSQMSWDEPLTGGTLQKWKNLTSDLMKSKPLKIERYYFTDHSQVTAYQPLDFVMHLLSPMLQSSISLKLHHQEDTLVLLWLKHLFLP